MTNGKAKEEQKDLQSRVDDQNRVMPAEKINERISKYEMEMKEKIKKLEEEYRGFAAEKIMEHYIRLMDELYWTLGKKHPCVKREIEPIPELNKKER